MISMSFSRLFLLLLSVLLVAGVVTGMAHPDGTPPGDQSTSLTQVNNTSNYMSLDEGEIVQTDTLNSTVDVTGAVQIDNDRIGTQLISESFNVQYDTAETVAERTAAVRNAVQQLEASSEQVYVRQSTALDRYNNNEITSAEFVIALWRADAATQEIDAAAETVSSADDSTLEYSIQPEWEEKLDNLDARGHPSSGPIRGEQLRSVMLGHGTSNRISVETSDDTVIIATIDQEQYIRESFAIDDVNSENTSQLEVSEAIEQTSTRYPWAMNMTNRDQTAEFNTLRNARVFYAQISHTHGELNTYLDSTTDNVIKEHQIKNPDEMPISTNRTKKNQELTVSVNITHETGPMRVSVADRETDEALNASVAVDGTPVGTTGSDGYLWTLDTRGATSVQVTTADGTPLTVEIPASERSE